MGEKTARKDGHDSWVDMDDICWYMGKHGMGEKTVRKDGHYSWVDMDDVIICHRMEWREKDRKQWMSHF